MDALAVEIPKNYPLTGKACSESAVVEIATRGTASALIWAFQRPVDGRSKNHVVADSKSLPVYDQKKGDLKAARSEQAPDGIVHMFACKSQIATIIFCNESTRSHSSLTVAN